MQIVEQQTTDPLVPHQLAQDAFSPEANSTANEAKIIREKVMRGLADVAAGRMLSGDVVEAECEALFG